MSNGMPMSSRPVVTDVDGTEKVLVLSNGRNFLAPLGLLANLTGDTEYTKLGLGLDKVDNTPDMEKPVSTAVAAAIAEKPDRAYVNRMVEFIRDESHNTFAIRSHEHVIDDVTGLQAALDAKATLTQVSAAVTEGREGLVTVQAMTEALGNKAESSDVANLALELQGKATLSQVEQALVGHATEEQLTAAVAGLAKTIDVDTAIGEVAQKANAALPRVEFDTFAATVIKQENVDQAIATAINNSGHVTTETLNQAIEDAVTNSGHVTSAQLDAAVNQAVEAGLSTKADASALENLVTTEQLTTGLSTKADAQTIEQLGVSVASKMSAQEVQNALSGYATEQSVGQAVTAVAAAMVSNTEFALHKDQVQQSLASKASQSELESKASAQALVSLEQVVSQLPKASDIPSVEGLLNEQQVNNLIATGINNDRDLVRMSQTLGQRVLWVNPYASSNDGATGSIHNPFKTVQAALDSIPANATHYVIMVMPSGSQGFTVENKQNILIQGYGADDSHLTQFTTPVVIRGDNATRVRFKDFAIKAPLNGNAVQIIGTQGRHYFKNVNMEMTAGSVADLVAMEGDFKNWYRFDTCAINGRFMIGQGGAAQATFYHQFGSGQTEYVVDGRHLLSVSHALALKHIENIQGIVRVSHVNGWVGKNGQAAISHAGALGMEILFSDLRNLTTEGAAKLMCIESQG